MSRFVHNASWEQGEGNCLLWQFHLHAEFDIFSVFRVFFLGQEVQGQRRGKQKVTITAQRQRNNLDLTNTDIYDKAVNYHKHQ